MCQLRCVSVKMCLLRSAHLGSKDRSQLTDVIKESSSFLYYLQSDPFQKPCWSEAGCPWQSELCSDFFFFFYLQRKENGFLWLSLKIKDISSQNYPGNLLCLTGPWRFRLLTIPQPAIEKEGVELPLLP